jgi:hypothetical protein
MMKARTTMRRWTAPEVEAVIHWSNDAVLAGCYCHAETCISGCLVPQRTPSSTSQNRCSGHWAATSLRLESEVVQDGRLGHGRVARAEVAGAVSVIPAHF